MTNSKPPSLLNTSIRVIILIAGFILLVIFGARAVGQTTSAQAVGGETQFYAAEVYAGNLLNVTVLGNVRLPNQKTMSIVPRKSEHSQNKRTHARPGSSKSPGQKTTPRISSEEEGEKLKAHEKIPTKIIPKDSKNNVLTPKIKAHVR
jgi:hypothetical protein